MNRTAIFLTCLAVGFVNYVIGFHNGTVEGVRLAHGEDSIRVSETDRVMQRVGICKWAKIMAEDIRCKTELP